MPIVALSSNMAQYGKFFQPPVLSPQHERSIYTDRAALLQDSTAAPATHGFFNALTLRRKASGQLPKTRRLKRSTVCQSSPVPVQSLARQELRQQHTGTPLDFSSLKRTLWLRAAVACPVREEVGRAIWPRDDRQTGTPCHWT